jgi:hypothetical protein
MDKIKITLDLPLSKENPGSLRFGFTQGRRDHVVSDIYLRKDKLREAGYEGDWPTEITVTLEVKKR